ncbi:unnamed protein product [Mytilus coruscus]|uniref:C2H2-type domain-containing protein n=1 Tax=Mytilus coruscus TaxID=42192 RepID=A0A6J8DJA3_MYTCO|nr:unnamed protein product [Mytilus coruscus]
MCVCCFWKPLLQKKKDLLLESIIFERNEQEQPADDTLQILKKIFIQAESWQFQRQVLSIIVQQMSFEGAQKFIPGLTSWRFYEAKRHANIEGPGLPVNVTVEKREKINANSLDHFIDFITSSHIMKDLPYGQRTLKLDSGEIINIPNVIRSLSSSSLISQYLQLCEEDNISPLGKVRAHSIKFYQNVLHQYKKKKSVEGLDNYVMEGSRAFQTLEEIFMDENNLKTKLLEAKRYLKADFKIHLARQTNVIQHCLGFALSIPGIEFQLHCQHIHSQHCQSCIDLDETLQKVLENAEKKQIENKDALMFKVEINSLCFFAGPCDRRAAHAKFVIKRFINEGRDVTSALDMKKALEKFGQKACRVRVVDTVLDLDAEKHKESIKNVSNFYNFNFADDGLRMWQAYNIGEGKLVQWDSLKPSKNAVQLKVISDWTDIAISDSYEDPVPTTTKHKQSLICPLENCIREFKNKETLDQHILQGQCEHQLEKEALSDKSKIIYAKKLSNAPLCCPDMTAENVFEDDSLVNRCCGWALKSKKKKTVFNQKQRDFMIEKFQIGKRTGSKRTHGDPVYLIVFFQQIEILTSYRSPSCVPCDAHCRKMRCWCNFHE